MKQNRKTQNIIVKPLVLMVAVIIPTMVQAEESPEKDSDIMVVTATRTEKSIKDVSSSITVVTTEDIQQQTPLSFNEILLNIPNVDVKDVSSPMFSKISIRGSNPEQITYLIDGMRQDNFTMAGNRFTGIFIDPEMVKQVEVRRGGGSSLYGNGGIGGTVAVTTKMAGDFLHNDENFGSTIKTGYASESHNWQKSAFVYGRHDIWDVIFGISRQDSGETKSSLGYRSDNNADGSFTSAMAKVAAFPTENTLLALSYNYDLGKDYWGKNGSFNDYQNKQHRITGTWEYSPNDWVDMKTTLQYVKSEFSYNSEIISSNDDFDSWSGNIQNTSRFLLGGEHTLTYGGDFSRTTQHGIATNPFFPDTHNDPSRPDSKGFDGGIFIQDEYLINRYITITPVIRWNYYKRESNKDLGEQSDNALTPGITATFSPNQTISFWVSANTGYRPPILDELYYQLDFPGNHHVHPNPDLKPEKSRNYEIGVNTVFNDVFNRYDNLDIKANLFWDDVRDFINTREEYNWPTGFDYYIENIGHVVRKGAELSANYQVDNFNLNASYGLIHAIDRKNDTRVVGITPQSFSIYTSYTFPSLNLEPWYRLRWSDGGTSNTKQAGKYLEYGSFTTHSLGLTWAPTLISKTNMTANIAIDNLTNHKYRYLNNSTGYGRGVRAWLAVHF